MQSLAMRCAALPAAKRVGALRPAARAALAPIRASAQRPQAQQKTEAEQQAQAEQMGTAALAVAALLLPLVLDAEAAQAAPAILKGRTFSLIHPGEQWGPAGGAGVGDVSRRCTAACAMHVAAASRPRAAYGRCRRPLPAARRPARLTAPPAASALPPASRHVLPVWQHRVGRLAGPAVAPHPVRWRAPERSELGPSAAPPLLPGHQAAAPRVIPTAALPCPALHPALPAASWAASSGRRRGCCRRWTLRASAR